MPVDDLPLQTILEYSAPTKEEAERYLEEKCGYAVDIYQGDLRAAINRLQMGQERKEERRDRRQREIEMVSFVDGMVDVRRRHELGEEFADRKPSADDESGYALVWDIYAERVVGYERHMEMVAELVDRLSDAQVRVQRPAPTTRSSSRRGHLLTSASI